MIIEWKVPSNEAASTNCRKSGVRFFISDFFPEREYRRVNS